MSVPGTSINHLTDLTPALLLQAAQEIVRRRPQSTLVKNDVGNLAVIDDGEYVGFIDLRTGEVDLSWAVPTEEASNG